MGLYVFRYNPTLDDFPTRSFEYTFTIKVIPVIVPIVYDDDGCLDEVPSVYWDDFAFVTTSVDLFSYADKNMLICGRSSTAPWTNENGVENGFMVWYNAYYLVQVTLNLGNMLHPHCKFF